MKSSLATPAIVVAVTAISIALISATPSFVAVLFMPLAFLLSLAAVIVAHVAASQTEHPTRAALILGYAALAVTVGSFMWRTFAAAMVFM